VLWLICGFAFGHYLAEFAYTYVNYYVGLGPADSPGACGNWCSRRHWLKPMLPDFCWQ
jgi:hypothetical protein